MLMVFKGFKQKNVLVIDTEYDSYYDEKEKQSKLRLLQFSGLLFKQYDKKNCIYQLAASKNLYVKQDRINNATLKYTGISRDTIIQLGIAKETFPSQYSKMFEGIEEKDVILIAHGVKNDRKVLKEAGVTFSPKHSFCTYRNAKRILNREKKLTLGNVAAEAGYFMHNAHDAYQDAWGTVAALSFLLKLDSEKTSLPS